MSGAPFFILTAWWTIVTCRLVHYELEVGS